MCVGDRLEILHPGRFLRISVKKVPWVFKLDGLALFPIPYRPKLYNVVRDACTCRMRLLSWV